MGESSFDYFHVDGTIRNSITVLLIRVKLKCDVLKRVRLEGDILIRVTLD